MSKFKIIKTSNPSPFEGEVIVSYRALRRILFFFWIDVPRSSTAHSFLYPEYATEERAAAAIADYKFKCTAERIHKNNWKLLRYID